MSQSITAQAPLLPLADLHLPPEPGFFPLAWGWWLVILFTFFLLCTLCYFLHQRLKKHKAKKAAIEGLKSADSIAKINILLKRAALSYFDSTQVAGLTGEDWLAFLDQKYSSSHQNFIRLKSLWINSSFSATKENEQELMQAKAQALLWLKEALPPKKSKKEKKHV